ncbi:hypothetical protein ABIB49_002986 [Arthrobacter sp. UYCu512]|uniref:hypothetical protein n=1 Tax=Arthrobacter sp. UYCu512 TaxID=3156338 RepID=UPI00339427ED
MTPTTGSTPGHKVQSFQGAAPTLRGSIEAPELPVERWVDIDINVAISKAAARLG